MSDRPRILVVDDEIGPRESLRMILKPSYEIVTADSGETALKTLSTFSPDLVFMDIKMPKMDGIELLQRIKSMDPTIEAVMITAYASLDTVKKALTHGAFEYLIKPFSRSDLEETVRRALARRQAELGKTSQLSSLVNEMRVLSTKTRTLEEEARREQAEQSLRVTQLSILREISRGILGQLDLAELTAGIAVQLKESLGYDEAQVILSELLPEGVQSEGAIVCPIRDDASIVGYLVVANRSSSGPIDPRERELLEMLADSLAVAITRPRWEERVAKGGVPLRLDLRLTPLPTVMGRPSELNEVITNLILNAIDAMPQGGTLGIHTRPEGDEHVVLTVADTGVGMAEHVRKRIFDPFFTTKGEVGTGLGLSVSYSIIQRHGGEMRAESQPGRGTTFTIVLPVGAVDRAQASEGAEEPGSRHGRILLVDNELPVMTVLGDMLTEVGHDVIPVASGAEALRVFVPGSFDLVMTNLGMTGLTGWDVAERVRTSDLHVPIVFITGWGLQAEDRERCRQLGVQNVLFKPLRPGELHQAVQEALAASTQKPGPAA